MSQKKSKNTCYAIKNLNIIVNTWDECKTLVHKKSGMVYKGFATREDAEKWLNESMIPSTKLSKKDIKLIDTKKKTVQEITNPDDFETISYASPIGITGTVTLVGIHDPMVAHYQYPRISVDGSYNHKIKTYGGGIAVIGNDNTSITFSEIVSGNNPEFAKSRNVAGEVIAFVKALHLATEHNLKGVTIICDYEGLYLWTKGDYSLEKSSISRYLKENLIKVYENGLTTINFIWVNGHRDMDSNETADKLAKRAVGL